MSNRMTSLTKTARKADSIISVFRMIDKDRRIRAEVPFLQEGTVLYVDSSDGANGGIEGTRKEFFARSFRYAGYHFLYLPNLAGRLDPDLIAYLFPGSQEPLSVGDMYRRIRDIAGLDDQAGFLYKRDGKTFFRALPDSAEEQSLGAGMDGMPRSMGVVPRSEGFSCYHHYFEEDEEIGLLTDSCRENAISFLGTDNEELPDARIRKILAAWKKIEEEFGITVEELDILLGYRVKLSRLSITLSGKVILTDWNGGVEVKMDDLTKALYFFYLRHPEGVALKELQTYEKEILHHYMAITGRDDPAVIRKSIEGLLNPYGNNLNVCISRIKKAFRDIVGDRIARFYYVDGHHGEARKVAINRDLVIWEH